MAALLSIGTGLWRYLGSSEKSADYYEQNAFFLAKLAILVVVLVLEIKPMVTLIRWRIALGRGTPAEQLPGSNSARAISRTSAIQGILVVLMVVLAVAMARGYDL